jgi:hypothetical protein
MRFVPPLLLLLPVAALAQNAALPEFPVETVHSDADHYVETIHAVGTGWIARGSRPQDYRMGTGPVPGSLEPAAFVITARPEARTSHRDFGTLMQMHAPGPFLGKRVRISARIKTADVRWAQLWLRADYSGTSSLCNMDDRPVRDTTDWTRHEIVLDVPGNAAAIAYGFFIAGGRGTAWMDGLTLEVVDDTVPATVAGCTRDTGFY